MAMAGVGGGQPSVWAKPASSLWVPPALLWGDNTGRERGMGCLGNRGVVPELVTPAVWDHAGHACGRGLSSRPARVTCLQIAGWGALSSQAQVLTPGDSGPGARWLDLLSLFRIHSTHFWGPYWVPGAVVGDTAKS